MTTPEIELKIVSSPDNYLVLRNDGISNKNTSIVGFEIKQDIAVVSETAIIKLVSKEPLIKGVTTKTGIGFVNSITTSDKNSRTVGSDNYPIHVFDTFSFQTGDLVYLKWLSRDNERNLTKKDLDVHLNSFGGFVKNFKIIDEYHAELEVQNEAFIFQKILLDYSVPDYEVSKVFNDILGKYDEIMDSVYKINELIKIDGLQELASHLIIDSSITNTPDVVITNFRAENITALEFFQFVKEKYFLSTKILRQNETDFGNTSKENSTEVFIVQSPSDLFYGFINIARTESLFSAEEDLFFGENTIIKNFDAKYTTYGLTDKRLYEEAEKFYPEIDGAHTDIFNIQSKSLEWQNATDKNVKVTINNFHEGERTSYTFGDENGEEQMINFFEKDSSEDAAKALATEIISNKKFTGYRKGSSITVYGFIGLQRSVIIANVFEQDIEPRFVVTFQTYFPSVCLTRYTISTGLQQTVTLDMRVDSNIVNLADKKFDDVNFLLKKIVNTNKKKAKKITKEEQAKIDQREKAKEERKSTYCNLSNNEILQNIITNSDKFVEANNEFINILYFNTNGFHNTTLYLLESQFVRNQLTEVHAFDIVSYTYLAKQGDSDKNIPIKEQVLYKKRVNQSVLDLNEKIEEMIKLHDQIGFDLIEVKERTDNDEKSDCKDFNEFTLVAEGKDLEDYNLYYGAVDPEWTKGLEDYHEYSYNNSELAKKTFDLKVIGFISETFNYAGVTPPPYLIGPAEFILNQ